MDKRAFVRLQFVSQLNVLTANLSQWPWNRVQDLKET